MRYAEALLRSNPSHHLSEVADVLCHMLSTHATLQTSHLTLLWNVASTQDLSITSQTKVLATLRHRFELSQSGLRTHDATDGQEPTIHDLVTVLQSTILSSGISAEFRHLAPWAACQAHAALCVDSSSAWQNARLMALVHAPLNLKSQARHTDSDKPLLDIDWQIVSILALLDKTIGPLEGVEISHMIQDQAIQVLESVWKSWTRSSHPRHTAVDRAIAATILRLAGILQDLELQTSCREFAVTRGFWYHESWDGLATAYALAAISCGVKHWEAIFPGLQHDRQAAQIVDGTIHRCLDHDIEIAHELYRSSFDHSIELSPATIAELGCAVAGVDVGVGVLYLQDPRLSDNQVRRILKVLVKSPSPSYTLDQSIAIGEAMLRAYATITPTIHLRTSLEATLLSMINTSAETASIAVQVIQTIHSNSPDYIQDSFMKSALQSLIDNRFFHVAFRLYRVSCMVHVDQARIWQQMLVLGFARGRANVLARRTARLPLNQPAVRMPFTFFVQKSGFDVHTPSRVAALKLYRVAQKDPKITPHELGYAIHLLTRARRMLAARKLYALTRDRADDASRTVMGNSILHASLLDPQKRNARRMQKVMRTLRQLIDEYGFVPDRVTVNILLKGILMWDKAIETRRLRAVFDHLLTSGYPGGVLDHTGSVIRPFGTEPGKGLGVPLADMKSEVDWEKHARPLYRMFVKAFHIRGDREAAWIVVGVLKRSAAKGKEGDSDSEDHLG